MAWLVNAGEGPKTRMGSQSTKHSHIDHKCVNDASNNINSGGEKGADRARICNSPVRE
jgi:hypothetical protein